MEPANFDESNCQMGPPEGMGEGDVRTLNVWRGIAELGGQQSRMFVSCWKPSREELDEIEKTGRVWLIMFASSHPPVRITSENPFRHVEADENKPG